jgi:hypothetical protein
MKGTALIIEAGLSVGLDGFDLANRGFATAAVEFSVKGHFLPLDESGDACTLKRSRMDENVFATIGWLNETKAFLLVVEFYCALNHEFAFRWIVSAARTLGRALAWMRAFVDDLGGS